MSISDPVIIIGMHRSGTSMLTRLLTQLGLWTGWDINEEYEASWFLKRNDILLDLAGGNWGNPQPFDNVLNNMELRQILCGTLKNDMHSLRFINYLGPLRMIGYSQSPPEVWGWKDPRNTFTLPLWLDIFPNARVIHIYRNGIDVAQSLVTREYKRVSRLGDSTTSIDLLKSQNEQIHSQGAPLYVYRKWQSITDRMHLKHCYEKYRFNPCNSMQAAFDLWQIYMTQADRVLSDCHVSVLELCYEHFLDEPVKYLSDAAGFCGLSQEKETVKKITANVRRGRRYAFVNNTDALNYYEQVKDNPLMKKKGYSEFEIFQESAADVGI